MRLTPLVVLAVAAVASCGGDDGGGTDAGAAGFAAMLADVPATAVEGELPMLSYVDMDLVWASLGVADDADDEARMAAFTSAPANGRFIVPPRLFDQQWLNVDRAREEIGFDAFAIRRELAVDAPPSELRLVDVAVDAATIETAIAADPTWSDLLRTVEHDAGTYVDWTPDGEPERELAPDFTRITPMRPLGIGGQLAVSGDGDEVRVVRTKEAALMEAVLAGDEGASAAERGPFAGADEAIEGDVLQVVGVGAPISGLPANLSPAQRAQLEEQLVFVGPYESILLVELVEEGGPQVEVLLLHADEAAAAANEAAVRELAATGTTLSGRPAADLLPGATVTVDGAVVRVTTDGGDMGMLYRALTSNDLFVTR